MTVDRNRPEVNTHWGTDVESFLKEAGLLKQADKSARLWLKQRKQERKDESGSSKAKQHR